MVPGRNGKSSQLVTATLLTTKGSDDPMKHKIFHPLAKYNSLLLIAVTILFLNDQCQAQTILDGSTPSGATQGAPAGSNPLSDLESINLFNGHLNLHVPMIGIGGRGNAQTAMMLSIENQWTVRTRLNTAVNPAQYEYYPELNKWSNLKPGYGPGLLAARRAGEVNRFSSCGDIYNPYSVFLVGLTRLTFVLPDGTEYELVDELTGGRPLSPSTNFPCHETGANRGRVFISADGSAATFISDSDIRDAADTHSAGVIYPTGNLMLRDGTRLRIEGGLIMSLRDRSGNFLTFSYITTPGSNYGKLLTVTDALGRVMTVTYDVADVEPYGQCDHIAYKGFGGADQIIRVSKSSLHNALRSGFTIKTDNQLFSHSNGGFTVGYHQPVVLVDRNKSL